MNDLKKYASEFARKGGNATKTKYGKEHYIRMGKLSGKSKRRKSVDNSDISA